MIIVLTESQQRMCQKDYSCLLPTLAPVHPATPFYWEYVCSQPAISDRNACLSTKSTMKASLWKLIWMSLLGLFH